MSTIRDTFNLIHKLNGKRIVNAFRVWRSFKASKRKLIPVGNTMPIALSIEPTTACNLSCPECPSGLKSFSRPVGNLKTEFNKAIIDQLAEHLIYLNFYFQGEPYINPHFLEMVKYAASKKIYTSTSTNAHFLNDENAKKTIESGLDRLIISIDGTTQETYEKYRVNGQLEKVIEGTRNIVSWKKKLKSKTPHLIFQFLVVRPNEHQINDVLQLANQLGIDEVRFKTAQVYDFENGNPLIPENEKYSRYKRMPNGKFSIKNKMENHCWRMWSSAVVTWDGKVVPCCFDKDAKHQLGDLQKNSFPEIWNSETYKNFRAKILTARQEIDICRNCSEGTTVHV